MKIKFIFLDLGGVLILNKAKKVGEKYLKLYGINPDVFRQIFNFIHNSQRSENEITNHLKEINVDAEIWQNYQKDFYASESRNDRLYKFLISLKPDRKIFFTTNNSNKLLPLIEKYQIGQLADWILNSSKANVAKPDANFWKIAFDKAKEIDPTVKKSNIFVIDDSRANIKSALSYGFQGFHYQISQNSQLTNMLDEKD